jgi:hypothetical protein
MKKFPTPPSPESSRRQFLRTLAATSGAVLLGGRFASKLIATEVAAASAVASTAPVNVLADSIEVAQTTFPLHGLPKDLHLLRAPGLVSSNLISGHVLHESNSEELVQRGRPPQIGVWDVAATVTPSGDYLVMFPEGGFYAGAKTKVNGMTAYRSRDRGVTWSKPFDAYKTDYNEHGFIPFVPRGTKRLYSFATQPIWSEYDPTVVATRENTPIGYRWSDDDGATWSKLALISPANDPGFKAMARTRMCETDAGVWLLAAHAADWGQVQLQTRQYILRSPDRGKTWTLAPGARPAGWQCPGFGRMDETRLICLGGENVLALSRTPEGHLWNFRSTDGGLTWSQPAATPLVHPDAPAMIYLLSDGKTLMVLHHNRSSASHLPMAERAHLGKMHPGMRDRAQLWISLSTDGGHSWEPLRFAFANALAANEDSLFKNYQCSYTDALIDHGQVHLFVPHRWRRVVQLTLKESDLHKLPTAADLGV